MSVQIAPSMLAADFARLGEEATAVLNAGADALHLDIMDQHYVPNLTFGPQICHALRNYGISATLDVHLMVDKVDELIPNFAKAGADYITFHPEASPHVDRSLQLIKSLGVKAGLALNPATSLNHLDYVLEKLDMILVMSVNPGFGGQAFITNAFDKVKQIRQRLNAAGSTALLAVDGGVTADNAKRLCENGADFLVAGSSIFKQANYTSAIQALR